MRPILVAALVALLAACASTPPAKPTAQVAPPAADSKVAAASHAPAKEEFGTIDASNIADAQQAGYRVINDNGQKLYCKKDVVTGTRLGKRTTCLTAAQLEEISAKGREVVHPTQLPAYAPQP
jgi:hypothetical protein